MAVPIVRPRVMGIVNVTPDSFSDGGRWFGLAAALDHARTLVAAGADILDIGGESTRPGAEPVALDVELDRVIPLIEAIRAESAIPLSIDTLKPAVARAAIAAGAGMWNDVTALRNDPDGPSVAAALGCEVVLMHMQGDPRTMQDKPDYADVVAEVTRDLLDRAETAMAAGVARDRIWLDPGIGFGKRIQHNLALLAHLDRLVATDFPVLLGASRKSFLKAVHPAASDPANRLGGSLAVALAGARAGVAMVRVHDVRETVQALEVWAAVERARS